MNKIKVSDVINQLQNFIQIFGDVDLKIAEYIEKETASTYSKKLILNDCNVFVGNFGLDKLVAVVKSQ